MLFAFSPTAALIEWILYEAGVAKGKLGTPVHGVALGVALSRVSAGPFYQFQNSDDGEESLAKLVLQLCRRVSNLEPDQGVVVTQVQGFKATVAGILKAMGSQKKETEKREVIDEGSVAKVLEEMKLIVRELPQRLEQRMIEGPERVRSRKISLRRFHPSMIEDMVHRMSRRSDDPIGLLIIASLVREDFPWLYEIGVEAYRGAKSPNLERAENAMRGFRDAAEATVRGPFMEELGPSKEVYMFLSELPGIIHNYMERVLERRAEKRVRAPRSAEVKKEEA
jgi:hypothetical protein